MDRRVRYTKMVLRQSLMELMRSRSINKITIKDICALADVSRGTFYAYYTDPYDLLHQIENDVLSRIKSAFDRHEINGAGEYRMLVEVMRCIAENRDICKIVLGENGDAEFIKNVIRVAKVRYEKKWSMEFSPMDADMIECVYEYVANGVIGLVRQWVLNDMEKEPKDIAKLIDALTERGLNSFMEAGRKEV